MFFLRQLTRVASGYCKKVKMCNGNFGFGHHFSDVGWASILFCQGR